MAKTKRPHSRTTINLAGKTLVELPIGDPKRENAVKIVDDWIAFHANPLSVIAEILRIHAKVADPNALVAQRTKRRPSVEQKLSRGTIRNLFDMQDLGGCRAVVECVEHVYEIAQDVIRDTATQCKIVGKEPRDYIREPKIDGYRSVHLIAKYRADDDAYKDYDGMKIEIQIRTRLQHAWATALEIVQFHTGQDLKNKTGNVDPAMRRFFALASGMHAIQEGTTPVPGVPQDRHTIIDELAQLEGQLTVLAAMSVAGGLASIVNRHVELVPDTAYCVLRVDAKAQSLTVLGFPRHAWGIALERYQQMQRESEGDTSVNVVIVGVDDVRYLQQAYPNYYSDTQLFVSNLVQFSDNRILACYQ